MPESKKRKKKGSGGRPPGRRPPPRDDGLPPVDGLVRSILKGGRELLDVDDPLDAEHWASLILGMSYKLPIPLDVQDRATPQILDGVLEAALRQGDEAAVCVLRALAAVGPISHAGLLSATADAIVATGVEDPAWTGELGSATFVRGWTLTDLYGDQIGYYAHFRYPGRREHLFSAVVDENLGGIVKDAVMGIPTVDPRALVEADPEAVVGDIEMGELAAHVLAAVALGDMYIDNAWTPEFKELRALLLTRMRTLPVIELPDAEPPGDDEREALVEAFLGSPDAPPDDDVTRAILDQCLMARCDFGDGDPLRWSPVVVELFLLDFLPRKAAMDMPAIRAAPDVLKRWVRFALARRGLPEEKIAETQAVVDELAPEFRRLVTDPATFGPAKAITNAMMADGVDLLDPKATEAWMEAFNVRPIEERDSLLGPALHPDLFR
jgi:hypothetical protein